MEKFTKKQKYLLIGGAIIFVIIGIYTYYRIEDTYVIENFEVEENNIETEKTNSNQIVLENEEKIKQENDLIEVKTEESEKILVHIMGEVVNDGVVEINKGSRIIDVINAAEGLTEEADLSNVNLAYPLVDGQKVYIPNVSETEEKEIVSVPIYQDTESNVIDKSTVIVNINTATQTELEQLTGIGPSLAAAIIQYRQENGSFKTKEDLKNVIGIGDAKYIKIEKNVVI